MIQFPEKFQERMQQMLGDEEYAEFLKTVHSQALPAAWHWPPEYNKDLPDNKDVWKTASYSQDKILSHSMVPASNPHPSAEAVPGVLFSMY